MTPAAIITQTADISESPRRVFQRCIDELSRAVEQLSQRRRFILERDAWKDGPSWAVGIPASEGDAQLKRIARALAELLDGGNP